MTIEELFRQKPDGPDDNILVAVKQKWDAIAKPVDGLGDLEDMICKIAAIHRTVETDITKKALVVMCADNGVVKEGVTQTGKEVTYDVATLLGKRASSVCAMSTNYPLDIFVYDVGIDSSDSPEGVINRKVSRGTGDFVNESAMSTDQCIAAISTGIEAVKSCADNGYKLIATGEMGIGNTTTATALLCAFTGACPTDCTGRGSGLTDEGLERKINVIEKGLRLHTGNRKIETREESFEALRHLGGLDIAALAGVFIGGAIMSVPIVIDGLISAAAALAAERIVPGCREYMIASHMGKEKGMALILDELSLAPVIHANMALGEGTGAVMLMPILDMAMSLYRNGVTFSKTPIRQYERFIR